MLRLWMSLPICGDFNMFGGLYRGWNCGDGGCLHRTCLLCLFRCILHPVRCIGEKAHLKIEALLSARETTVTRLRGGVQLYDKEKLLCRVASAEVGEDKKVVMDMVLERPHLWDGVKDPYLYKGVVILRKDGKEIDQTAKKNRFPLLSCRCGERFLPEWKALSFEWREPASGQGRTRFGILSARP